MARPHPSALLLPLICLGALCDPAVEIEPPYVDPGCSAPMNDTADTQPPGPPLEGLELRLHEEIESLVYTNWEQLEQAMVWVEYGSDTLGWQQSPARDLAAGPQEQILLGIPYEQAIEVRLVAEMDGETWWSDHEPVSTGEQPTGVPTMEVLAVDEASLDPGVSFLLASIEEVNGFGIAVGSWSFIFDRQGRVVWALESPQGRATIHARLSWDGTDLLLDHNSFYALFDGGAASQVARYDIDGTQLALYDTPGMHHPFTDTPSGDLVYLATAETYDSLVRVDTATGQSEVLWACQPFQEGLGVEQYCTSNSVSWHEPSQRFLVSFYSSDTVVEIDPTAGEATRWFGHLPGAWGFDPEDSAFWWQHGAHLTEAGTLLVSTKISEGGEETLVREYNLDSDEQLLRQVWSFGEGQGVYGEVMGEAWRLAGGNTLHNYGSGTRVREVTPDGDVVWDVGFSAGTFLGRTTPIDDLWALAP
jgi:hypothetical protein